MNFKKLSLITLLSLSIFTVRSSKAADAIQNVIYDDEWTQSDANYLNRFESEQSAKSNLRSIPFASSFFNLNPFSTTDDNTTSARPQMLIEVFKVAVDNTGRVTNSILNITGTDNEAKEFVLVTMDNQLKTVFATSTAQSYKQRWHKGSQRWVYPETPEGSFAPESIERKHWSTAYEAWMPYTIFFNGGIALHATSLSHYARLGVKDSGGCSRLALSNAAQLCAWVNPKGDDLYSGSSELSLIRQSVKVNVYGFDDTSDETRTQLRQKYAGSTGWIQNALRADLKKIQDSLRSGRE